MDYNSYTYNDTSTDKEFSVLTCNIKDDKLTKESVLLLFAVCPLNKAEGRRKHLSTAE
jgi:hypothetical protein